MKLRNKRDSEIFRRLVENQEERDSNRAKLLAIRERIGWNEAKIKHSTTISDLYEPLHAYPPMDNDEFWDTALKLIEGDCWGGTNVG